MKRGQIMGLPLVLLFALIVGALILAFGMKYAFDLVEQAEYVDFLGNLDDIENNIETYGNYDEGSAKVYELSLPTGVEMLCFYKFGDDYDCKLDGETCDEETDGMLELLVESNYNVYLMPQGLYDMNRFSIESFETEEGNPECISNGKSMLISSYDGYVGIGYYE